MHPRFLLSLPLMMFATAALAHTGNGMQGGLLSGFTHPLFGLDHIVAMVAVGLWGAFLGAPAIWVLPVVFPLVMSVGAALGVVGVAIPGVETGIAMSGVVLGLLVLFAVEPPLWIAAIIVATFATFHGYAHGVELPSAANPFAFALGFVAATGLLHLSGIALGFLTKFPKGEYVVRAAGLGIAATGAFFLSAI